ncbi:serine protease inhibitor dipetalogastin-like [Rhodnius prolixus]|uniref:Kazal-like domain-containing protein n=2 Tax=Rhodnius prolixus TaxID=13249 RepID=T1IGD5_RHOPR
MTSIKIVSTIATILVACLIAFTSSAVLDVSKNFKFCSCTKDFSPVCATNGITYPNKCIFNCNNVKGDLNIIPCGLFTLELVGDTCTRKCNHLKRLVCGTDGVTYENPCMFKCAQQVKPSLKMAHMGHC